MSVDLKTDFWSGVCDFEFIAMHLLDKSVSGVHFANGAQVAFWPQQMATATKKTSHELQIIPAYVNLY